MEKDRVKLIILFNHYFTIYYKKKKLILKKTRTMNPIANNHQQ